MSVLGRSNDVKTPLMTLAFANGLIKPQRVQNGDAKKYGCSLLFPKGTDLSKLQKAAIAAAVDAGWGDEEKVKTGFRAEVIKSPFLDGDGKSGRSKKTGEVNKGFAGTIFLRVTDDEEHPPKIFDQRVRPTTDKNIVFSGAKGYAVVSAYAWQDKQNGRGVSFGLSMVQITDVSGERLGGEGSADPSEYFEPIADEGDAPAATKDGSGAAGLFG